MRTYSGTQLPPEKVALLKGAWNEYFISSVVGHIRKVDGKDAYGGKVEILPGKHEIVVYLAIIGPGSITNGIPQTFTIIAEAGHTYKVDGNWNKGDNQIWIVDEQTGKIVAGKKYK